MLDLEKMTRSLIDLLEEEVTCLEATAEHLRKDRKALISGRGSVLAEATQDWDYLSGERKSLDRRRALLLDRIAAALEIPASRLNITKISRCLQGPLGIELRRTGDRVRKAAREAAIQASVGKDLLEESARFHEGLLRSISAAVDEAAPAYGQSTSGKIGSSSVTMVDRMV